MLHTSVRPLSFLKIHLAHVILAGSDTVSTLLSFCYAGCSLGRLDDVPSKIFDPGNGDLPGGSMEGSERA